MAAENLMCKILINIGPDGRLHYCVSIRRWVSLFMAVILNILKVSILALFPKGLLLLVYTATGALQVRDHPERMH